MQLSNSINVLIQLFSVKRLFNTGSIISRLPYKMANFMKSMDK